MISKRKSRMQYVPARRETDKRSGAHTPRIAPEMIWERELRGMKSVRVCPRCSAVYYDKHWHAWQGSGRVTEFLKNRRVEHALCMECSFVVTGHKGATGWEGELRLQGVPSEKKTDVLRTVRNTGARAVRIDPEDQIIKIEDRGSAIRITTTENQLAVRIGKKLDESFKGGKLAITFSHEDEPVRVVWTAPEAKNRARS